MTTTCADGLTKPDFSHNMSAMVRTILDSDDAVANKILILRV